MRRYPTRRTSCPAQTPGSGRTRGCSRRDRSDSFTVSAKVRLLGCVIPAAFRRDDFTQPLNRTFAPLPQTFFGAFHWKSRQSHEFWFLSPPLQITDAENMKLKLEQNQRERRREMEEAGQAHEPRWFRHVQLR